MPIRLSDYLTDYRWIDEVEEDPPYIESMHIGENMPIGRALNQKFTEMLFEPGEQERMHAEAHERAIRRATRPHDPLDLLGAGAINQQLTQRYVCTGTITSADRINELIQIRDAGVITPAIAGELAHREVEAGGAGAFNPNRGSYTITEFTAPNITMQHLEAVRDACDPGNSFARSILDGDWNADGHLPTNDNPTNAVEHELTDHHPDGVRRYCRICRNWVNPEIRYCVEATERARERRNNPTTTSELRTCLDGTQYNITPPPTNPAYRDAPIDEIRVESRVHAHRLGTRHRDIEVQAPQDPFRRTYNRQYMCEDCGQYCNNAHESDCSGSRRTTPRPLTRDNFRDVVERMVEPQAPSITLNFIIGLEPMNKAQAKLKFKQMMLHYYTDSGALMEVVDKMNKIIDLIEGDPKPLPEAHVDVAKLNAQDITSKLHVPISLAEWSKDIPKALVSKLSFHDLQKLKDSFIKSQQRLAGSTALSRRDMAQ